LRLNLSGGESVIPAVKTRPSFPLVFVTCAMFAAPLFAADAAKVTQQDDRVRIELGGSLFTEFIHKGAPKPYCYPVLAADGTQMNRDYPMKKVDGEDQDHPHHRSVFFTHGDVNGFDFWAETGGAKQGKIVTDAVKAAANGSVATVEAQNRWVQPDGTVACTDTTIIRAQAIPGGRLLDYEVTIKAPADKPVVFRDTKEGSMSIRVAQWMTPPHGNAKKKSGANGTIVNDSGVRDTPESLDRALTAGEKGGNKTWGKKSAWVDYYAPKDGKVYGVAMFDHPKNPRYPTWWHVRDYGLFSANPFGQHDFENKKDQPRLGDLTIEAGKSVTFRWRLYFHMGDEKAGKVAERYADYAAGK
jgi:hypothetical protein